MENITISRDGRYIVGFDTIVDTSTNMTMSINNPNPLFLCEFFKTQTTFNYKHSLVESTDLFGKMRKVIYQLLESDVMGIMEYEVKYGHQLLIESKNTILTEQYITDSWDFVKSKILKKYPILNEQSVGDWISDKAGQAWDGIKKGAEVVGDKLKQSMQWVLTKGIPWFMENLEKFLMSPVGIGLDIALTSIGVGKLATGILWGMLLIWKVYKYAIGESDKSSVMTYVDLAVCLAGLVFSGAAKGLKMAFKAAGNNILKVSGQTLQPIISVLSKGATGILNLVLKPIEWLSKVFGTKAQAMVSSFKSNINGLITQISKMFAPAATKAGVPGAEGLGKLVGTGLRKDIINPLSQATGKTLRGATVKGLAAGGAVVAAEKGISKGAAAYADYQKKNIDREKLVLANTIPDDMIKQGIDSEMGDLLKQLEN